MAKTLWVGIATFACCGLALAKAPARGGGGDWDAKGAAEAKATVEKMLDSWNKMDAEGLKSTVSDGMWSAWDLDLAQQPGAWSNKAEMGKFFDDATAMMKKMGGSAELKVTKIECKASGMLALCMVEGDQSFTMPKMPPMMVSVRSTEVLTKEKGAWKFVHHHGSVAKEAMPSKSMATSAKASGGWMEGGPDMPGVMVMPLWMNAANMNSASLMKVTKTWKQARHMHPYGFTFAVLEGKITTSDENGKDHDYGPGSVIYRAAGEVHQTTLQPGAVIFSVGSGPMATVYVDDKGQPINK